MKLESLKLETWKFESWNMKVWNLKFWNLKFWNLKFWNFNLWNLKFWNLKFLNLKFLNWNFEIWHFLKLVVNLKLYFWKFYNCFNVFFFKFKIIQDSIPGSLNLNARGGCHKYGAINDVTSVGRGSIQDVNPMRCNL